MEDDKPSKDSILDHVSNTKTSVVPDKVDEVSKGPELKGWKPTLKLPPAHRINTIRALGDLHGWAPGLIAYLTKHGLAKIEVNGLRLYKQEKDSLVLDLENMASVFPSQKQKFRTDGVFHQTGLKNLVLEGMKPQDQGFHSIKAEWIAEKDVAFVQIGDVFDRGDYSELSAEILRQLVIQAPLQVFILLGNHEQFLIENDFRTWLSNEQRFHFHDDLESAFHTRFHAETYHWAVSDESTIKKEVFERYVTSARLLYLTQFAARLKFYPEHNKATESLDVDKVLAGGWDAYKYAASLKIEGHFDTFQGGLVLLGIGHSVFTHAGPKAFKEIDTKVMKSRLLKINHKNISLYIAEYHYSSTSISESIDAPLLWSRGGEEGITAEPPNPGASGYISKLLDIFPGCRHHIHGHSPTPLSNVVSHISGNRPICYLARPFGNLPTEEIGSVRIHMIDEGITPVYVQDLNKQDISRVPIGLVVHPLLLPFQDESTTKLEEDADLWLKILEQEHLAFTVPQDNVLSIPNRIGAFAPGMVIWSDLEPDQSGAQGRYLTQFEEEGPLLTVLPDSVKKSIPARGYAVMIYEPGNIVSSSKKLYNLSTRTNTPIDQFLFDYILERFDAWAQDQKTSDLFQGDRASNKQLLSQIHQPKKHFGDIYSYIEEKGFSLLISECAAFFCLFGLDKGGYPYFFFLNGRKSPVHMTLYLLDENQEPLSGKLTIQPSDWMISTSNTKVENAVFLWSAISSKDNIKHIKITIPILRNLRDKREELQDYIRSGDLLSNLLYIKARSSYSLYGVKEVGKIPTFAGGEDVKTKPDENNRSSQPVTTKFVDDYKKEESSSVITQKLVPRPGKKAKEEKLKLLKPGKPTGTDKSELHKEEESSHEGKSKVPRPGKSKETDMAKVPRQTADTKKGEE